MVKPSRDVILANNLDCDLTSVFRLKNISQDELLALCNRYKRIVTVEEHAIQGGLASITAEALAGKMLADIRHIAIKDRFTGECGSYNYLLKYHGLDNASLLKALQ